MRDIAEPTLNKWGDDVHPAYGLIGATRGSSSPGAVLFDSDIRHQHTVTIRISTASRKRDLNRDWIHGETEIVEVEVSEAQWASFVSSMNSGSGVPCTIRRTPDDHQVPGLPYAPRMAESLREVQEASERVFGRIAEALAAYEEKKNAANLKALRLAVEQAGGNLDYVAKSMAGHAEGVVQRARADVEAFVLTKARQIGMAPSDLESPLELLGPEPDTTDD